MHIPDSPRNDALTRRKVLQGSAALLGTMLPLGYAGASQGSRSIATEPTPCDPSLLPAGIRSRIINVNGLHMHVLEAGFDVKDQPCIVLLHGFPELAYSWRKVMLPIARAGFHVIAPDRRGYGRTSGRDVRYDDDPARSRLLTKFVTCLDWLPPSVIGRSQP